MHRSGANSSDSRMHCYRDSVNPTGKTNLYLFTCIEMEQHATLQVILEKCLSVWHFRNTYMNNCSIDYVTDLEIWVDIPSDFMDHAPISQNVAFDNHPFTIQKHLQKRIKDYTKRFRDHPHIVWALCPMCPPVMHERKFGPCVQSAPRSCTRGHMYRIHDLGKTF